LKAPGFGFRTLCLCITGGPPSPGWPGRPGEPRRASTGRLGCIEAMVGIREAVVLLLLLLPVEVSGPLVPGCDTGGPPPGARPGLWRCCGLLIAVGGLGQLPPPGMALLLAPTMPGMPIMLAGMPPCFMPPAAPIIIMFGFIPAPPIWDGIRIRSPIGA